MPRRKKTPKEGEGFQPGESSEQGRQQAASQDVRVQGSSQDVRVQQQTAPQHERHYPPQQGRGGFVQPGRGGFPQQQGRGGGYMQQGRGGGPGQQQAWGAQPPFQGQGQGFAQQQFPQGGPQRQPQTGGRGGGELSGGRGESGGGRGRGRRGRGGGGGGGPSPYAPPAGPVRPSFPDLPQAFQPLSATAAPYQQQQVVAGEQAGTGMQVRAFVPEFLMPAESSGPPAESSALPAAEAPGPVEEQFQRITLQATAADVAGTSQVVTAPPMSSKGVRFPMRPGMGKFGNKCIVKANHFFAQLPDKDLHQYDVSITPEVTSRGVNRAVMEQLVKLYRESHLGRRLPAYDGRKSLYTAGALPFTSKEFNINLVDEDDGMGGQRRERSFKVVIKFAARADLHHLGQFLSGRQADAPQEALQVLDIVLRELPTHRYSPVGRSFYSPDLGTRKQLGEGLESWRGFYQSIRPTQMGLSLNIDMSSTAFIEPLPVIDFVAQLLNRDMVSRPLSDADRIKIKKALRGVKVEVTHRANMRRKYRISGLTSQPTRELT
eukprot:PITA_07968